MEQCAMKTQIVSIGKEDTFALTEQKLLQAGEIIKQGGLVAFPTETVYGLGGDALNPESSKKIYAAKGRPSDNPLIIHIAELADLDKIVEEIPKKAQLLAQAFWPGPLTIILKKAKVVPSQTTGGLDTVAVRMPSHPIASRFIKYAGGYVAAPSANRSGKPSPTMAKYVIQDLDGRIDMILDAEGVEIGLESTIVDLTTDVPMIVRPGYITQEALARVVGEIDIDITIYDDHSTQAPKAPGMKYRHYAPKGELVLVEGERERVICYINEQIRFHRERKERTGILGTEELLARCSADSIKSAGKENELSFVAKQLYTFLREFDDEEIDYMYAECFSDKGLGQAVMNRLLKAAGHKVVKV